MKILIRDVMQESSGFDPCMTSPALADICTATSDSGTLTLVAGDLEKIDCVGIGYTDATMVTITFSNGIDTLTRTIPITKAAPYQNGLYVIEEVGYSLEEDTLTFDGEDALLDGELWDISYYPNWSQITIAHNGTYIGRVGMGRYRKLGTNFVKEIGWYTNIESIVSESGQTIPGAGGYYGRTFDADVRHKIESDVYDDMDKAAPYIMRSFPYFLCLDDEQHKLPANMYYFYAATVEPITKLQSSTYKFLYSYKFEFQERF